MIELYYENYILINIDIPNYEEIKKKYFDNEGNKIVLLNDNYSIQSPFEYFTPVIYCDPEGRGAILAAIIAGAIIGMSSTYLAIVNKNIQNDGFQWSDLNPNFKEKWIDYLVNTASGAFIGLFGSIGLPVFLSAPLCGLTNTIANALTGDIKTFEEGIQCFLVSTLISSLTLGISRMSRLERLPAIRKGNYIELLFRSFGKIIDPFIAFLVGFLNAIKDGEDY